jgi:cystathionine beta-lyase/cystathionine gamma-synthase
MSDNWGFDTVCQHLAEDYSFKGAVVPPIFQNSLFVYDDMDTWEDRDKSKDKFVYTRVSNPTTEIVEKKLAALEGTERCRLFGSGMGAISAAVMSACEAGKHIVCTDAAYGPTKALIKEYLPQFGVESTFVDGRDTRAVESAIRPNTSCIYLESPGTFFFHIQDIRAITAIARERGLTTILDNSNATPYFQQPASLGVDLVVHTATKYLGGHSDVVAGVCCGSEARMAKLVWEEGLILGAVLDPFASWLLLRSLRTLPIRMERHQQSGLEVARFLESHPKIAQVFHPGLPSHEGHDLARTQMSGTCGLVSFKPAFQDRASVKRFCEGLKLFQMGVSWGGHESLIAPLNVPETEGEWLFRLSVGLETPADLIADLSAQLANV